VVCAGRVPGRRTPELIGHAPPNAKFAERPGNCLQAAVGFCARAGRGSAVASHLDSMERPGV